MQQEQFRQALAMVQRQQTRLKTKLDEKARSDTAELSAVQTATKSLETNIAQQVRLHVVTLVYCMCVCCVVQKPNKW